MDSMLITLICLSRCYTYFTKKIIIIYEFFTSSVHNVMLTTGLHGFGRHCCAVIHALKDKIFLTYIKPARFVQLNIICIKHHANNHFFCLAICNKGTQFENNN